jgi:rhamnogalacturonyl hydrolase YesR
MSNGSQLRKIIHCGRCDIGALCAVVGAFFNTGRVALIAGAVTLSGMLVVPFLSVQVKTPDRDSAGDTATIVLPIATDLSPKLNRKDVAHAMQKVGDWQLERARAHFNQDWTYAALYAGFMAVPEGAGGKKYQDAMLEMGRKFNWELGPRIEHADDAALGQTYLDLYFIDHDPAIIAPTRERMDAVMRLPEDAEKPLWWWCDALFMAPPVLAKLAKATGDRKYLDFMDREWRITTDKLYSPQDHLYYRDKSFLGSHEANGNRVFWSRGNGWVFAGLARVLAEMPADYPSRPRYVAQFREMAEEIASLQGADGLWRAGLLDEADYKLPENSGSAFFTYGFAYGINAGILDRKRYKPVVEKAWRGLLAHVYQDGRLGSIQPIGAAPGAFTETSSYVYGTGAFLLAGSEVYRLAR